LGENWQRVEGKEKDSTTRQSREWCVVQEKGGGTRKDANCRGGMDVGGSTRGERSISISLKKARKTKGKKEGNTRKEGKGGVKRTPIDT